MSKLPRKNLTALQRKELQQEAGSKCAWCGDESAEGWEFHHIDGRPENTVNENLIMLCGRCHNIAEANNGKITIDDLYQRKRELAVQRQAVSVLQEKTVSPTITDSIVASGNSHCSFTQNVYTAKKTVSRVAPAPDSIACNAEARNKINMMIRTLGDYRLKGHPDRNARAVFSAIQKDLAKHFEATSFLSISMSRFDDVVAYLQEKIDGTVQGRINKGRTARKNQDA